MKSILRTLVSLILCASLLGAPTAPVVVNPNTSVLISPTAAALLAANPTLGGMISITGTANEITVAGTTTPTLSLPAALTFTGKTVTGGTFTGGAFNGTLGATTPSTIAGTTGVFSGPLNTTGNFSDIYTTGADATIYTEGADATINTEGATAHIYTAGANAFIRSRSTFKLFDGTFTTTLSHAPTADRAIAFPNAAGTLALVSGDLGTPSAIVLTNASGTLPAGVTIPLGTVTLTGTLPDARLSANVPLLNASNTYTGTTNTFTLPTTTGTTTASGIAVAANSLTTGTGIYASSTSLTTGKLMELAVSPTGTQAPISLNLSATWNTSGSPTLLKGRITNTASGSYTSYILDFGTVATRYFGLSAEGRLYLGAGGIYVHEGGAFQNNSGFVQFSSSLASTANNSHDLGANSLKWRTLYVGTSIENSGTLAVTGSSVLTGNLTSNGALISTPEALSPALDAGAAVGVTTLTSTIAVNGTNAVTLANGTNGQIKTIVCTAVTAAGTATVTPTTANGFTTIAFTAAGQSVTLQYFSTGGWVILSVRNATIAALGDAQRHRCTGEALALCV
jgi:hypothetical protein